MASSRWFPHFLFVVLAVTVALVVGSISPSSASAQTTRTWTGAGSDANWSNPQNWDGTAPVAGDSLLFPAGADRHTTKNDLAPGLLLGRITVNDEDYSLDGNAVSLSDGLFANQDRGTAWVNLPIFVTNSSVVISTLSARLVLGGDITGGDVIKGGEGRATFNGDLTGQLDVRAGTAVLNGHAASAVVRAHARLRGHGSVEDLDSIGGIVAPGASPGIFTAGTVTLDGGSTFGVELDGPDPGTGYSQLVTAAAPSLNGVSLAVDVGSSMRPPVDTVFTIIKNNSQSPIGGAFDGLPQGARFRAANTIFKISYLGGDGNDVTLTVVELVDADVRVTMTASPEPVAPGGILTYTITVANAGPYDSEQLYFIVPVSDSATFVSLAGAAGWSCELPPVGATGQVRCQRVLLATGESTTFVLTVRVDADAKGQLNPKAVILTGTPDSASYNDQAQVVTHISGASSGPRPFRGIVPLVAADGP